MRPNGGFEKLFAASMVQVSAAAGDASTLFYRDLSSRIGDYTYIDRSTNTGQGGIRRTGRRSESIMDVSDLDALSVGRMIVFASGCRASLVRAQPWFKGKRLRELVTMRPEAAPRRREQTCV